MAARESMIGVQTQAGAEDGGPGCAEAPEALLPRVTSRVGHLDTRGRGETPFSASLSVLDSPSGSNLGQLGMPPLPPVRGVSVVLPSETKVDVYSPHHSLLSEAAKGASGEAPVVARSDTPRERDRRFDQFKTFSGRLERQFSTLRGLPHDTPAADDVEHGGATTDEDTDEDVGVPSVGRYFAALEGPEFETLRSTEVAVLPKDELWPFLLRFPITAFGMCLGVNSQAMLWKTLEAEPSTAFLRVHPVANRVFWCVSVVLTVLVSVTYLLKVVFYYEAVRREFHHPVRVNFFFAPWIACLFLVKGVPRPVEEIHHVVWYLLMAPILCLDLKIYGEWMSSGERRLSRVANPSNHLAVVGNFVGALLGARMGLRELPIFFFAVGLAHYTVLFVTLYQRLPTNVQLPKELHPVFFLFVAAPSVASMAWARISGEFDSGAKLAYFVSMFLYASLVVRVNLFRGIRFSLAWWAYTFPMTSVALATVLYASEVDNMVTRALAVGLSLIAAVTVTGVLATTAYHALVLGDLFPNDVSIAITTQRLNFSNILEHLRSSSSDLKDLVLSIPNFSSNSKLGACSDDLGSKSKASSSTSDESPATAHGHGRSAKR